MINSEKESKFINYYTTIFPYKEIFKTINISKKKELAFGLQVTTFMRYETFDTPDEFYNRIKTVNPYRIDVGATYKERPKKTTKNEFVGKELVFDIDLTDYDRKCCTDKNVCEKCYELIKCTIEIFDYVLKEEFGFKNYGFVFSGRRGVHCWVFGYDELDTETRSGIFRFFNSYLTVPGKKLKAEYKNIIKKYSNSSEEDLIKWFPRIDKQVTVKTNHLIKMPFSVHPETMKVSIPLDPVNIKEYRNLPSVDDFLSGEANIKEYVNIMERWINEEQDE